MVMNPIFEYNGYIEKNGTDIMNRKLIVILFVLLLPACTNMPQDMKESIYTEAAQTLIIQLTETAAAITPSETATVIPSSTPTEEPTVTTAPIVIPTIASNVTVAPTTSTADNPYKAEFVWVDPYPNQFIPGQKFTLTWQLKNVGTATWSGKYHFYHNKGIQLADQSSYSIDTVVAPGEILTISMPATAPSTFGTYQTEWAFANPEGVQFYYVYYTAIVGEQTFVTDQPGAPTSTPNSLYWMCSDPDRSNIQGNGCEEYCHLNGRSMDQDGVKCYSFGNLITDFY